MEASEPRLESSTQVGRSAGRQVGRSAGRRHTARERSCARIERGSPGWRCLLRAATGYQHTPQTADRKFGADSKGVVDFSSDLIDLCSKHSLRSIFLIIFWFFNYPLYTMRKTRLLAFLGLFLGIYPLFWQRILDR